MITLPLRRMANHFSWLDVNMFFVTCDSRHHQWVVPRLHCLPAAVLLAFVFLAVLATSPAFAANASANIPLDSPVYTYLDKLGGFGLFHTDIRALRPLSRAEAARLLREAEAAYADMPAQPLAEEVLRELRALLPRETATAEDRRAQSPLVPMASGRLRFVYLDGVPRSYERDAFDSGHQSAFGFIGGDLRPVQGIVHHHGTEGTPLLEYNEGVIYGRGANTDLRISSEAYAGEWAMAAAEPMLLQTPAQTTGRFNKLYGKIGGGGVELEVGRDALWFGPGYRGALTLTNNARNLDMIKIDSPEPLDVAWVRRYIGQVKYALVVSRLDEAGTGANRIHPWWMGLKASVKPKPWLEVGGNFVRQFGGIGSSKSSSADFVFGGGMDNTNSIAGFDVRFRLPWLRNTEIYGEYAGEDSASFWPFVESYVAGFYVPRLTADGRDDLRFEFFWGHPILYTDWTFPDSGYTYHHMPLGHAEGGGTIDFYLRYGHWFSARHRGSLEYFHTERGNMGRIVVDGVMQRVERKDAARISWTAALRRDIDLQASYGWEYIRNFDLAEGNRTNQLARVEVAYRY